MLTNGSWQRQDESPQRGSQDKGDNDKKPTSSELRGSTKAEPVEGSAKTLKPAVRTKAELIAGDDGLSGCSASLKPEPQQKPTSQKKPAPVVDQEQPSPESNSKLVEDNPNPNPNLNPTQEDSNQKSTQQDLDGHDDVDLLIVGKPRPYKCKNCDEKFSSKHNLRQHAASHKSVKPYSCHHCDRKFSRKGNLNNHLQVHLSESNSGIPDSFGSFTKIAKRPLLNYPLFSPLGPQMFGDPFAIQQFRQFQQYQQFQKFQAIQNAFPLIAPRPDAVNYNKPTNTSPDDSKTPSEQIQDHPLVDHSSVSLMAVERHSPHSPKSSSSSSVLHENSHQNSGANRFLHDQHLHQQDPELKNLHQSSQEPSPTDPSQQGSSTLQQSQQQSESSQQLSHPSLSSLSSLDAHASHAASAGTSSSTTPSPTPSPSASACQSVSQLQQHHSQFSHHSQNIMHPSIVGCTLPDLGFPMNATLNKMLCGTVLPLPSMLPPQIPHAGSAAASASVLLPPLSEDQQMVLFPPNEDVDSLLSGLPEITEGQQHMHITNCMTTSQGAVAMIDSSNSSSTEIPEGWLSANSLANCDALSVKCENPDLEFAMKGGSSNQSSQNIDNLVMTEGTTAAAVAEGGEEGEEEDDYEDFEGLSDTSCDCSDGSDSDYTPQRHHTKQKPTRGQDGDDQYNLRSKRAKKSSDNIGNAKHAINHKCKKPKKLNPKVKAPKVTVKRGRPKKGKTGRKNKLRALSIPCSPNSRLTGICKYCGKHFSQTGNLVRHLRTHLGVRPFQCPHCLKRFSEKGNMKRHLRIHSGEKPYQCPQCEKRFTDSGTRAKHAIIHTGQKPFGCIQCDKRFNQQGSLKRHMQTHSTASSPKENNKKRPQFFQSSLF